MSFLRSLGSALLSPFTDRTPHHLAMGVALGVLLGFPIPDRHAVLPLLFVLLLRNNVIAVALGAVIGRGAGVLFAQQTFDLGVSLLRDRDTFDGVMTWLCNAPFFGLLGLNRYIVFGGFAIALPASVAAYVALRLLLPRLPIPSRASRRAFPWNVVRRNVLIGIPVVLLVLTAGSLLAVQFGMTDALARGIQTQMGAETRIASSFADPLEQRVGLTDLVVADTMPNEKQPMIQVREMSFALDSVALLSGRLVVPEVLISGLSVRLIRAEDGTLNITRTRTVLGDDDGADREYWRWVEEHARDVDWLELLSKTVEHVKKSWEQPEEPATETATSTGPWFDLHAARSYAQDQPLLTIGKFALENCRIELEDRRDGRVRKLPSLHTLGLTIENLSSDRALLGKEVVSRLTAAIGQDTVGTIDVGSVLGLPSGDDPSGPLALQTRLANVDLRQLAALFETTMPVDVARGVFEFVSDVTVAKGGIRPSIGQLSLQNLELAHEQGMALLGLDSEASFWLVRGINAVAKREAITLKTLIEGPVENPRLHWEAELLALGRRGLQYLGPELAAAGAERYLGQINQRLGEEIAALGSFGKALGPDLTQTLERDVLGPLIQGNPEAIGKLIESGRFDDLPKSIGGQAIDELLPKDLADPMRKVLDGGLIPGPGQKPGEALDPQRAVEGVLRGVGDLFGPKKDPGSQDPAKTDPAKKLVEGVGGLLGGKKEGTPPKDPGQGLLEDASKILKGSDPEPAGGADRFGGLIRGAGGLLGGRKKKEEEKPPKEKPPEGERKRERREDALRRDG